MGGFVHRGFESLPLRSGLRLPRMINDTTQGLAPLNQIRAQFPGLAPDHAHLDGAAGTHVPEAVVAAIAEALRFAMANVHGAFRASRVSTEVVAGARSALAD